MAPGLLLASPALLFLAVFLVYPVADLIYLSFHDYSPLRGGEPKWVGIDNYASAVTEPATLGSIWTTIVFTLTSVAIELVIGLFVAVLLARVTLEYGGRPGRVVSRMFAAGFILPFAIPGVVAAVAWKMFLDPQIGPIDVALGSPVAWFTGRLVLPVSVDIGRSDRRLEDHALCNVSALCRSYVD
jgi:multiple sugar transport system permease protein